MDKELSEAANQVSTQIERISLHVEALDRKLDNYVARSPVPIAPFGGTLQAWVTRIMIGVIVALQLLIGGVIALRLKPDGYNRTQARANWVLLCEEMKKHRPEFVCPPIAREKP